MDVDSDCLGKQKDRRSYKLGVLQNGVGKFLAYPNKSYMAVPVNWGYLLGLVHTYQVGCRVGV